MTKANDLFGNSNGTGSYYRHPLSKIVYTDGVRDMAEACGAYWLIDLIISHQVHIHVNLETFQVWDLIRLKDNTFTVLCTDGNKKRITGQEIPFSDFRYDMATLWLVDGVLLLPCEY
jgi:hypothetical protein